MIATDGGEYGTPSQIRTILFFLLLSNFPNLFQLSEKDHFPLRYHGISRAYNVQNKIINIFYLANFRKTS